VEASASGGGSPLSPSSICESEGNPTGIVCSGSRKRIGRRVR